MFETVAQDIALDDQHQANHYRSHCSACCYNRVGGTNKQVALHANGGGGSDLLGRGPRPPPASWSRGPSLGLCVCPVCVCPVCVCVPCVASVCPVCALCGQRCRHADYKIGGNMDFHIQLSLADSRTHPVVCLFVSVHF